MLHDDGCRDTRLRQCNDIHLLGLPGCDTNQTSTGTPEASFRSAMALWDYVPLMARGNPMS
eukprot:95659-Rhodomonas_salina.1